MKKLPTDQRILDACRGVGYDDLVISKLSANEKFEAYCQWTFGNPLWASVLQDVLRNCK